MAQNINRLPRGLLSYLDSQTQGNNPDELATTVQPVLDMEPFYRSMARYEYLGDNLVFNLFGGQFIYHVQQRTVPDDEVWLVHQASTTITNQTGLPIGLTNHWLEVRRVADVGFPHFYPLVTALQPPVSIGNAASDQKGHNFSRPIVVPPGVQIQFGITSGGVGDVLLAWSMILQKLKI